MSSFTWRPRPSRCGISSIAPCTSRRRAVPSPASSFPTICRLSPRLPERCILTCDSGSAANWYARDLRLRNGMLASLSGGLATMGCAVPYAIAAKYAYPSRHVIALLGDGAMQMNGINGLITIAKVWREWETAGGNGRLTVMVLNNGDLNQVTWEQRALAGDPKFMPSQRVPDFPYAEYARLLGLGGIRVNEVEHVGRAWDIALASERPTVLEMVTDPNVPPLPPHVTLKQVKAYLSAMFPRDPDSLRMVTATFKETWESLFPPR